MTHKTNNLLRQAGWQDEFEKIYPPLRICDKGSTEFKKVKEPHRDILKSFIANLLQKQREEIVGELENKERIVSKQIDRQNDTGYLMDVSFNDGLRTAIIIIKTPKVAKKQKVK